MSETLFNLGQWNVEIQVFVGSEIVISPKKQFNTKNNFKLSALVRKGCGQNLR